MAMADQGTYAFIPPPPLPEFYKKAAKQYDTSSTSSASSLEEDTKLVGVKELPTPVDGAYDGRPNRVNMYRGPWATLTTHPTPPLISNANEVPPLAIYHICRLCLRPRSSRYHREHPIPIDGLPPPPGICRRCRVTSIEETKTVADIVRIGESNDIKIGFITPFIPQEDIISNEEMRARKVERYLRQTSSGSDSNGKPGRPRKDIVYRHLRVVDEPDDTSPKRTAKVKFSCRDQVESLNEWPLPEPPRAPIKTTRSMQVQPTEKPSSVQTKNEGKVKPKDNSKASNSTQTSTSSALPAKPSTSVSKSSRSYHTSSDIRQIARQEVERYRDAYWKTQCSDSKIRRIAREEVERYRQAERKLEAHPDPYAHGRMVPVERRIEKQRDVPEPMPWIEVTKEDEVKTTVKPRKQSPDIEQPDAAGESSTTSLKLAKESCNRVVSHNNETSIEQDRGRRREQHHKLSGAQAGTDAPGIIKSREVPESVKVPDAPERAATDDPHLAKSGHRDRKTSYRIVRVTEEVEPSSKAPTPETRNLESGRRPRTGRDHTGAERYEKRDLVTEEDQAYLEDKAPTEPSTNREPQAWSKSRQSIKSDKFYNESAVQTSDSRPTRNYQTSGSDGIPRGATKVASSATKDSIKYSSGQPKGDKRSDKTRWPGEQDAQTLAQDSHSARHVGPPYPERDMAYDRVVWPSEAPTKPSFRSGPPQSKHAGRDDDVEYLYTERIVQPANRTMGRRPFDDHPPARYVEIEEVIETRRNPTRAPSPPKGKSTDQIDPVAQNKSSKEKPSTSMPPGGDRERHYRRYEEIKDRQGASNGYEATIATGGSSKLDETAASRQSTNLESYTHKRQPPCENSAVFQRQSHSFGKHDVLDGEDSNHVHFSNKVDISPTPPDSDASSSEFRSYHSLRRGSSSQRDSSQSPQHGGHSSTAYGRGGRSGDRHRRAGYDSYENLTSSIRKDKDEAPGESNEPAEEIDHASKHTRKVKDMASKVRDRVDVRGRKQEDRNDDGAGSRPLARALSESPAREESLSSFGLDGRGPYRVHEEVTDSMRVEDGSPGGTGWDWQEETVYTRREDSQRSKR